MIDDRLSVVQQLFDQATRLPPSDRDAFLGDACGTDTALHDEIASLLRSSERIGGFLEGEVFDAVLPVLGRIADPGALIGRAVGAYRIEKLIGTGGMAVVYLARQTDPDRLVALKLIRPGFAMPGLVRRLHDEAQVLARLRHPGIAQIFEAGCADVDSSPQPFFAMEYVAGESLVSYADARGLSIPERLELLARVCDALHHAHQQGVIHRDLKPQNILVIDDAEGQRPGQPKIIDFGVAKLVGKRDATLSDQTTIDRLVGTPSYMSPEQFDDPREGVDVRSDIYAVGVIGYELLTGALPHDLRNCSIGEALRTIAETAPIAPGSRNKALRGDISIILMTALASEKERRYQSASMLGADIRHVLRSEPISARPPSFFYELSRHARRNKLIYGALTLAFLLLLAGTVGTSIGLVQAREAYDESEAVTSFVGRMVASVDPYQDGRSNASMREVLQQMSAALDGEFAESPLVRATLQHFVGCTLTGLGKFSESEPHIRQALETRRSLLGPDHPRTIESMEMLGQLTRSLGALDESRQLLSDVLERRQRLLGAEHPDTLRSLASLAQTYVDMERLDDAEALLLPAWEQSRALRGDRDPLTLELAYWFACSRHERSDVPSAEPVILHVYQARMEDLGELHPATLAAASLLASLYLLDGRMEDAERLVTRTHELQKERLGDQHPETLTTSVHLAEIAMNLGRFQEADARFRAAEEGFQRQLGPEHASTLTARIGVARASWGMARHEEAARVAEEAYELVTRLRGPDSGITLAAMQVVANICHETKQFDRSRSLYADLLERRRRVYGASHMRTLEVMNSLAASLAFDESRRDESVALFEEVLEIRLRTLGREHPRTLNTLNMVGRMYELQGRTEEALALMTESVETGRRVLPRDHWFLGLFLRRQGACLAALHRLPEAEAALQEGQRILELEIGHEAEAQRARRDLAQVREAMSKEAAPPE